MNNYSYLLFSHNNPSDKKDYTKLASYLYVRYVIHNGDAEGAMKAYPDHLQDGETFLNAVECA